MSRNEGFESLAREREAAEVALLGRLRERKAALGDLLAKSSDHWGYEDPVYRFYHQSFKVYWLQGRTQSLVRLLLSSRQLTARWTRGSSSSYAPGRGGSSRQKTTRDGPRPRDRSSRPSFTRAISSRWPSVMRGWMRLHSSFRAATPPSYACIGCGEAVARRSLANLLRPIVGVAFVHNTARPPFPQTCPRTAPRNRLEAKPW
jgi:hypothetical protein